MNQNLGAELSFLKVNESLPPFKNSTTTTLVVGFGSNEKSPVFVKGLRTSKSLDGILSVASSLKTFEAKPAQTQSLAQHSRGFEGFTQPHPYQNLVLFGVGTTKDTIPQNFLSWGGRLASELRSQKFTEADILIDSLYQAGRSVNGDDAPKDFAGRPLLEKIPTREEFFELFATGFLLGLYKFDRYKSSPDGADSKDKSPKNSILKIRFVSSQIDGRRAASLLKDIETICRGVYRVRDLQTTPGGDLPPSEIAKAAQNLGKECDFSVTVWDEKKIKSEGMNGIISVGQGSDNPPRFIIMEHNASKKNLPTVVLVGKGISFDTGGYCLKPAGGMEEMKMDMSGSAAVIGAMSILSELKVPVRVIGLVASAENMISGRATRPGDIYKALDGQTVEVINTDAEGRLVLADALVHAKNYNPDCVIDIATLTGAVTIALGAYTTGMMGNNGDLLETYSRASHKIGERVWELPLYEEYKEDLRSKTADLRNVGTDRGAGSQKGGAFLHFFVKNNYPWIHLDVAATADTPKGQGAHCPPDVGTGVPTRGLVEFVRNWAADFSKTKKKK